jgi:hypothetical protein
MAGGPHLPFMREYIPRQGGAPFLAYFARSGVFDLHFRHKMNGLPFSMENVGTDGTFTI